MHGPASFAHVRHALPYQIELYISEHTGLICGHILYEPANLPPDAEYNLMQLAPEDEDETEAMGQ